MNTLMGVVNKLFLEACYKTTNTVKLKFWVSCTIIRFKVTSIRALSIQSEMNYFTICESYGKKKNVKTVEHWTVLVKGTHYFFHVQDLLYSRFFFIDGMSTYSLITITVLYGVFSCQYKHVWLKIISDPVKLHVNYTDTRVITSRNHKASAPVPC